MIRRRQTGNKHEADQEQTRVIQSRGSAIVIAGPGSGKTFCLVEKALHEANKGNSVLALTFTRAAAQEIRNRTKKVEASTIHALAFKYVGFNSDYDEMLEKFLRQGYKPKYDVVLVDEFQDLNELEMRVVLSVCKDRIFLVGDPKQSIFGYTEAVGSELAKVDGINKLYLRNNYRSNSEVVRKLEKVYPVGLVPRGNGKLKGTSILFRTNQQMDEIAYQLKLLGHDFQVRRRGTKFPGEVIGYPPKAKDLVLSTIHCAKGTEFRKVLVVDWGYRLIEKNLNYVALSRASEEVVVVEGLSEVVEHLTGISAG